MTQPNIRQKFLEQARIRVENLGSSPLERIKEDKPFDIATLAYAAGFFDGEGSITVYHTKEHGYRLHVFISSTDRWACQWYQMAFGGYVSAVKPDSPHLPQWQWHASYQIACRFLKQILPYLHLKKPQAELAIRFQETKTERVRIRGVDGRLQKLTPEVEAQEKTIYQRLREMKREKQLEEPTRKDFGTRGQTTIPIEQVKAMCQGSEFDCQEAEMRSKGELAAYYRGRAGAFNSVLSLIRELER